MSQVPYKNGQMTKKQQIELELKVTEILKNLSYSHKLKVIERLGKHWRLANNLEIKKENDEFSKGIKRSA
jgi:hypothetical protein